MRKLSATENRQIITSIITKEITSAEILMEIYDHYVSHLQESEQEVFDKELWELDQKFNYAYCHMLQSKLKKQARLEIGKAQLQVLKKYFCLSRVLYLVGVVTILTLISFRFSTKDELTILMFAPILLLFFTHVIFTYRSFKKQSPIKKLFKDQSIAITSSVGDPISERMYLPVILLQVLLFVPKILLNQDVTLFFLPQIAIIITTMGLLYTLSLLEVWKTKSKTALI